MDHERIQANQIAAARVLLDITQIQLADLSGVSPSTVKRIEAGLPVTKANQAAVVGALEIRWRRVHRRKWWGPGVRLKKARRAATKPKKGD